MKLITLITIPFFALACQGQINSSTQHQLKLQLIQSSIDTSKLNSSLDSVRLVEQLKKIYYHDQMYRDLQNPDLLTRNITKQNLLDSLNQIEVARFIKKFGIRSPNLIGLFPYRGIVLTLAHSSLPFLIEHETLIEKAFENRQLWPIDFAIITDKICVARGIKQRFGTQIVNFENKPTFYPMNIDEVTANRKSINLKESIHQYLLHNFKYQFDISEYKRQLPKLENRYLSKNILKKIKQ